MNSPRAVTGTNSYGSAAYEKIKPTINGTAETMLQSFYARAQYSKSKIINFMMQKL